MSVSTIVLALALANFASAAESLFGFRYDGKPLVEEEIIKASPDICQSGKNQSPVDLININKVVQFPGFLGGNNWEPPNDFRVYNNDGMVHITPGPKMKISIAGGAAGTSPLDLVDMRFQFGPNPKDSEHLIEGQAYEGEVQLLFVERSLLYRNNPKYTLEELVSKMVKVVFLMELAPAEEESELFPKIRKLVEPIAAKSGAENLVSGIDLLAPLAPIANKGIRYVFYEGSLTRAPCTEGMKYVVFETPVKVAQETINFLKNVRNEVGQPVVAIKRPLQVNSLESACHGCKCARKINYF